MKFDKKEDISNTISNFEKNGNYYTINYLDGNTIEYYNSNENHEKELLDRMLENAIKRDKNMYAKYQKQIILDITNTLITVFLLGLCKNLTIFFCLAFLSLIVKTISDLIKYNELDKYHDYIIIKDDLEKKENSNILDIIEVDKIHQVPINLNTIDEYSNRNIKILKREIERRKEI